MLKLQSTLRLKDNSKLLNVKVINLYKKKKLKFKDSFLGVVKVSKNQNIKNGHMHHFLIVSTRKSSQFESGKTKSSDSNCCIAIRDLNKEEPIGTRFLGVFYSELKRVKNQKCKNLLSQCI